MAHAIPKSMLPVKLPDNIDLNVKGNPLDKQTKWKEIVIDGKKMIWLFGITAVVCTVPSGITGQKSEKVEGSQLKVIDQNKIHLI